MGRTSITRELKALQQAYEIVKKAGIEPCTLFDEFVREIGNREQALMVDEDIDVDGGEQAHRSGNRIGFKNGLDRTLAGLILERQGMKGIRRQLLEEDSRSLKFADATTAKQAMDIINHHNLVKIAAEMGK